MWTSASYRFFRYASYERTRRSLVAMSALSARVRGFSLQAAHAYSRQTDYWHCNNADRYAYRTAPRDELEAHLFGRLGYDPSTPERALRRVLRARTGTDAFWDAEQAGTDLVAWMITAHTCGPDSRDHSPQLEWTGPVGYWALPARVPLENRGQGTCGALLYQGPLDPFAVASPYEAAQDLVQARAASRISPLVVAKIVAADVARLRAVAGAEVDEGNAWVRDVKRECAALAELGAYFVHRLRGASALAVYSASGAPDYLAAARTETALAGDAWRALADATAYVRPLADAYRTVAFTAQPFYWRCES